MSRPTTRVYISFDTGWVGSSPTWVEVTKYVKDESGINITVWRSEELSQAQPNQCSLTLRNDDGRFTPGNTASPHYPNVRLGRRLKVVSTLAGVDYVRFLGYIDDWHPAWTAKVDDINDCTITATSQMARLGKGAELRSVIEEEILLDTPTAYYTLSEPAGATTVGDTSSANGPALPLVGSGAAITFGSATGPGTDGLTAAQFAGGQYIGGRVSLSSVLPGAAFDAFFLASGATSGNIVEIVGAVTVSAHFNGTGKVELTLADANSTFVTLTSTNAFNDGLTHHLAASVNYDIGTGSTTIRLYVDGVAVGSSSTLALSGSTFDTVTVGRGLTGTISHVAFYRGASAATLAQHYDARTGFAGETPASRITRYASFVGIAPAALSLDTGQVPDLAHIDTTGKTAFDAMRVVEATEEGVLFDARDGTITFHDRAHRYTAPSAFTLNVPSGHIAEAPEPVLDDQRQVNDVIATGSGGATARVTDTASKDDAGWYRSTLDLATTDPDEPLLHASWRVNQYADPVERVSAVEVLLNKLPDALVVSLLNATVGTKFTITGMPTNGPGPTLVLFVEGMTDAIDMSTHRLTLHTSPASLSDVWTVEDATLGALTDTPIAF